jgi:hypothetical protein
VPAPSPIREDAGAWDAPSAVGHDAPPLNPWSLLAAMRPRRGHTRTTLSSAPPQSACACPRMSQIRLRWPGVKVLLTTAIAPRLLAASFCMSKPCRLPLTLWSGPRLPGMRDGAAKVWPPSRDAVHPSPCDGIVKLTPKIARLYSKERTIEGFGLSRAPVFSLFPALQLSSRERCLRRFFINLTMPSWVSADRDRGSAWCHGREPTR